MFRAIATIGAIQALVLVSSLVRSKMLAVLLGPEGVGVLGFIEQVVQLVSYVSALSLPLAAGKYLSRAHSEGSDVFQRTYANLLRLLVVLTTIGTLISLMVVILLPELLGSELIAYRFTLFAAIVRVPVIALHGYFVHLLAAAQRWRSSALLLLSIALALAATTPIGIWVGGLQGMYWSQLIVELLVVVGTFVFLKRRLGLGFSFRGAGTWAAIRETPEILTYGSIIFITSSLNLISYFVARYLILSYEGEARGGLFHAAITLTGSMGLLLNQATTLFLLPLMNRAGPSHEKFRAAQKFQCNLMLMVGLMGMALTMFAPLLLTLMFSAEFDSADQIVYLLVIGQGLIQLAAVYQAIIIGLDDLKIYGVLVTMGHLSLLLSSWLVIPRYGLVGASVAIVVANGLIFLLTLLQLILKHGFVAQRRLFLMLGYFIVTVLVAGEFINQQDGSSLMVYGMKVLSYGLFVSLLCLLFGPSELVRLMGVVRVKLGRQRFRERLPGVLRPRQMNAGVLIPVIVDRPPVESDADSGSV